MHAVRHLQANSAPPTLKDEWVSWLSKLENWQVVATLTFETTARQRLPLSDSAICGITTAYIARVNQECFRHGARRKGFRVGSAFSIERRDTGEHPHVHMSLTIPPTWTVSNFERTLRSTSRNFRLIGQQIDIQPYQNSGWIGYCVKHGTDGLVVEHIQQANPR